MSRNLLVVNGHPDPRPERFCAALCEAFSSGAQARGCAIRRLDVGALDLASLASTGEQSAWQGMEEAFRLVRAADRLAIFYPLWADAPPAGLTQMFAYLARLEGLLHPKRAAAKSASIVVTTALPALVYRNKLEPVALTGIRTEAPLFIGSVEAITCAQRLRWIEQVRELGKTLH
ncbi:MAG: NAD(P)H-dependent oxidoreductase [Proteobacteria bacterium]|nr:NAD(P)H-dependent oxidoreductase [Pseudomonadota bacterium]